MARLLSAGPAALWSRTKIKPSGVPRIDWSHPLTRGLISFVYDPGNGGCVDLVRGNTMVLQGTTRPVTAASRFGTALNNAAANEGFADAAAFYIQAWAFPYSFACAWYQVAAATGTTHPLIFGLQDNTGQNAFTAYLNASTVQLEVGYGNGSPAGLVATPANGTFNVFVGAATGATAQSNYLNGTLTTTAQTSAFTGTTMRLNIAGDFNGWAGAGGLVGTMVFWGAVWNVVLSAENARMLYNDPYCFLIPAEPEMMTLQSADVLGAQIWM